MECAKALYNGTKLPYKKKYYVREKTFKFTREMIRCSNKMIINAKKFHRKTGNERKLSLTDEKNIVRVTKNSFITSTKN